MKRLLLLLLLPVSSYGQYTLDYKSLGFASELRIYQGDPTYRVIVANNDYFPNKTGGIYEICSPCYNTDDSINYIGSIPQGYPGLPSMWHKIAESPSLGNMTGQNNNVIKANGLVPTWTSVGSLFSSLVLSYANGVITGTLTPISGTPLTDTVNVPNTPTGLPPNLTLSTPTRVLGTTGWTPHATKGSFVSYTLTSTASNPLVTGTSSSAFVLEYYNGSTWQPLMNTGNSNGVALAVAISLTNGQTGVLSSYIPAAMQIRIVNTNTGSATGSIVRSSEWN